MSDEVSRVAKKRVKRERTGSFDAVQLRQAYGEEPTWEGVKVTDENYRVKLMQAYNWANASFDTSTLKKITTEYMQNNEEFAFLKELPDYYFIGVGSMAWLRMNKAPFTKESNQIFIDCLEKLKVRYEKLKQDELKEKEIVADTSNKLSAEQTARLEYVGLYSMLDNLIKTDNIDGDKVYDILRSRQPTQQALRLLADHYKTNVEECDTYGANKLKLNEKKFNQLLRSGSQEIVAVVEKVLSNVRSENKLNKIRKLRKRRIKPAQMQVKNLKFKESDGSLKLVSIPPASIIAAPTLITFNSKTRKVSIYYAKNTDGLSVKGTTIQNFDTEKSKSKTLRKPEEMVGHLIGTSLFRFEKVFEGIKAKLDKPNGRINDDTLLLKIFKT